jgi:O-antigen/teichoic acid export membrane protein
VRGASPLVANTAITGGTNLLLASLGLISGVLAARLLGPHGRGELAAIQTWPNVIATLAMLGMPEALVYFSARDAAKAGRYLASGVVIALVSSGPFVVAACRLMPLLLASQTARIVWAARWYLLIVPLYALIAIPVNPLRGRGDFASWNAIRLAPNVAWIAVLVLAWAAGRAIPEFVAGANLVALTLLFFPFTAVVVRCIPGPFVPDPQNFSSMLRYGLPCMATSVPQMLNLRLDQMLMTALLPPGQLGLYVVAVAWSGATAPLLNAVGAATTPSVASADDQVTAMRRFATGTRVAAALALAGCLVLAAVTPPAIIVLFGQAFHGSIPAALVLVPAGSIAGFNFVLQEGLRGIGRPYAVLQAELAGLLVTVIALTLMLQRFEIMGAAVASLLGYSAVTVVLLLNVKRLTGTSPSALLPNFTELCAGLAQVVTLARAPSLHP